MDVLIWRCGLLPASETFIRHQGEALAAGRATFLGATKIESFNARGTDLIAYPGGIRGRWGYLWLRATGGSPRLRRIVRERNPALIHAHFGGDAWLISRTAQRLGIPLIVTLHGIDVTRQAGRGGPRGARYRRNLRTAFHRAALILAVSEHIRQKAIELGADPGKVRVHHTGVPIPPMPAVAKKWDVAFVGRFVEKKGIDDLVEALGTLPKVRALFIGGGPLEERIRQRAADLELDATFAGVQEPAVVRRCLAESRLFVSPSRTAPDGDAEGLPTTIVEAASVGLPVVSTVHSGIPEAVVHGETGLLGPEGDREALAGNIRRLLADEELRARMGRDARLHAEKYFDLQNQTRVLEELYASVLSR